MKVKHTQELIKYLDTTIKQTIQSNVIEIAKYHNKHPKGNCGWFNIPLQVFCYIDHLGAIAYRRGGKRTNKAIQFIKDFFPNDYSLYPDILVAMWRHGTVHNLIPYIYYIKSDNKKIVLSTTSNRSSKDCNRKVHMKTFRDANCENKIYLSINIHQLAEDLLTSLDKFIEKIEKDKAFYNECQERLNNLFNPQLKTGGEMKKQILKAQKNCEGTLDNDTNIQWD